MAVYFESTKTFKEMIRRRKVKICVVGVGTIGLPAAIFFASKGFRVVGFDVNERRVEEVNKATCVCEYPRMLEEVVRKGKLRATTDAEVIGEADVLIVCVPTPLDKERRMDMRYLLSAADEIGRNIKRGALVVLESSVSPGSTRKFGKAIEERSGLRMGVDFGLAYTPERYNPTLPQEIHGGVIYNKSCRAVESFTFNKVGRVVGGVDKKSAEMTKILYSAAIDAKIVEVSSLEASEATKLLENIFRDVNIALVNEISKVYSKLGLDTFEIIEAAKSKPFAFLAHYPGTGVGGECIPVDTWYLIKQAEEVGVEPELMKTARKVNDSMPKYVVELLERALRKVGKKLKGSRVCLLGLAYKRNINDSRQSPTFDVIRELQEKGVEVDVCDPIMENVTSNKVPLVPLEKAFDGKDAVVLVTDHDIFKKVKLKDVRKRMRSRVIIDGRNFFNEKELKRLGFIYAGVGKALEGERL